MMPPMPAATSSRGAACSGVSPMIFCRAVCEPEFSGRWKARMRWSCPPTSRQLVRLPE